MIGKRMLQVRTKLMLTQVQLSKKIGLPQQMISFYETGKREPSIPSLSKFARSTGVNIEWLVLGTGKMLKEQKK